MGDGVQGGGGGEEKDNVSKILPNNWGLDTDVRGAETRMDDQFAFVFIRLRKPIFSSGDKLAFHFITQ